MRVRVPPQEQFDMPTGHYLTKEQSQYIIAHFADTPNKALADSLGISVSCVNYQAHKYRLRKSIAHDKQMHRISGKASAARGVKIDLTPEVLRRRADSYKRTHRTETIRVKWGLNQQTKVRVAREPKAKLRQRRYLRSRGYIIADSEYTAYYTSATKRSPRLEAVPRGEKIGSIRGYFDFKRLNIGQESL